MTGGPHPPVSLRSTYTLADCGDSPNSPTHNYSRWVYRRSRVFKPATDAR